MVIETVLYYFAAQYTKLVLCYTKDWQPATDLGDPTYWLSYEYKQIQLEMQKLNDKMNLILSLVQNKPKKSTITEVDKKVDNLINMLHKKRKVEE